MRGPRCRVPGVPLWATTLCPPTGPYRLKVTRRPSLARSSPDSSSTSLDPLAVRRSLFAVHCSLFTVRRGAEHIYKKHCTMTLVDIRPTEIPRVTDSRVLVAMAHPLRRRLLNLLKVDGPATASALS